MGLFQKAYETYECFSHQAGIYDNHKEPLAPVGHIITSAQIEIMLDRNGKFIRAFTVGKDEPKIIIPVTEESSGRTSGICPHPLCDQIGYISSANTKKHDAYVEQLTDWALSEHSHPMLGPILTYVKGKTILSDLAHSGIKNAAEKDTVRWTVIGIDDGSENCWKNNKLFESFIGYYTAKKAEDDQVLCMITGQTTAQAHQHLKGIISLNGNAKLISANDTSNFTYRGRFKTDDQAVTIGYDTSQKAHNALKWLAADQGVIIGGRTFLCWNPQGKKLPPRQSLRKVRTEKRVIEMEDYRKDLAETLLSYKNNFKPTDDAVIAVFDAATTGRLAVTYYNEMPAHDFLDNLAKWDLSCCFRNNWDGVNAPSLERIINCAFGTERSGMIEADEKVVRQHMQRLLVCRVENGKMPYDIVHAIACKTMRPMAYEKSRDYLQFTACAVIRKYYLDHKQEEYDMALEKDKNDISYQYGRLLAVLDHIELYALWVKNGKEYFKDKRDTNAIRMQSAYCNRPAKTAEIIIQQLKRGYYHDLHQWKRNEYEQLIGEIYEKISAHPESQWNAPLKETYILGYYLQKNALYTKNKEMTETEESENE